MSFCFIVFIAILNISDTTLQKNTIAYIPTLTHFTEVASDKEIPIATSSKAVTKIESTPSTLKTKPMPEYLPAQTTVQQLSTSQLETIAWLYPGEPACAATHEYQTIKNISILKPEYFMINEEGILTVMTEKEFGCNGYSPQNIATIKLYSNAQYATVSSSYAQSMNIFLTKSVEEGILVDTLVAFAVDNNITGIEIDFEDFGGWDSDIYKKYKRFITNLGTALHAKNKKLMVDGPAISNDEEQSWFIWKYEDFTILPIDHMVVMAYDYQYDQGAGSPISPLTWITNIITWTKVHYKNQDRITIGIPSYGYRGIKGTQKITLLTYDQIKMQEGFATAVRDTSSYEMTWSNGNYVYFYQDRASILKKISTITASGIHSISVWHLGGNLWFEE